MNEWVDVMRSRYAIATIVACISLSPVAASVWDKVDFGQSRSEVEANYPKGGKTKYNKNGSIEVSDVTIIGNCEAESNIYFDNDEVSKIVINGNPSMGGRCSDTVFTALASKYGQPLGEVKSEQSLLAREGKVSVWTRPDGVTMRFKRFTNGAFGGGGLAKASWELTYTTTGGNISL